MDIHTLKSRLTAAINDASLSLTGVINGVDWNLPAAIATRYLNTANLSLAQATVEDAPAGSVMVKGTDQPSVLVKGRLSGPASILGIELARFQTGFLFATPVDANDNNNANVNYTLVLEFDKQVDSTTVWQLADSFPVLEGSVAFESLETTGNPAFLLGSFTNDLAWTSTAAKTFPGVSSGLNLQLPANFSGDGFDPVQSLFGDLTLGPFVFNGTIDNTQTGTDPNHLTIKLMAVMGSAYDKPGIPGNSPIALEFDLGLEALPVQPVVDAEEQEETFAAQDTWNLKTQLILQAHFGKVLVRSIIPFSGQTISFSMEGLDDKPVLSLGDIAALFSQDFLSGHVPESLNKEGGFLDNIGIDNVGLTLALPETSNGKTGASAGIHILRVLLRVGYTGAPIGFPPWFDLQDFFLTWIVANPFTQQSQPTVILSGDFELLHGIIDFSATFSKPGSPPGHTGDPQLSPAKTLFAAGGHSTASPPDGWVFDIQGGLRGEEGEDDDDEEDNDEDREDDTPDDPPPAGPPNVIHLTDLLKQFDSHATDLPEIDIDALFFHARPEKGFFEISFDLEVTKWNLSQFHTPEFDSLALDITKDGDEITGSIDTKFSFVSSLPPEGGGGPTTIDFELSAARTEDSWVFEGKNDDAFSLGDLTSAFGFTPPAYLNEVIIEEVDVKYTAPIQSSGTAVPAAAPADASAEKSSVFEISIDVKFPIASEELEVSLSFEKDAEHWELTGELIIGPKTSSRADNPDQPGLKFTFSASDTTTGGNSDTLLTANLSTDNQHPLNISDFATALGATPPPIPEALNDIELISAGFEYETAPAKKSFLLKARSAKFGNIIFLIVKTGTGSDASWKPFFGIAFKPTLDFGKLPVVGDAILKFGDIIIEDIMLAGIAKALTQPDIAAMNELLQQPDNLDYPQLPPAASDGTLPAEAIFHATIDLNGDKRPIDPPIIIPLKKSSSTTPILAVAEEEPAPGGLKDNSEQKISKSIGPVQIDKFNLSYKDGSIILDINGSITLAAIAMSFQGLGIKMKFPPEHLSDVSFQLHGLGVNIQQGDLQIAGGFISVDDNFDNFVGMLTITAGQIGLQAFGGYATTTPQPSFFIFLHLRVPLGGPPFFFIDGLSGGFGINRNFIMPSFDELDTFPLLPQAPNNPIPDSMPKNISDITDSLTLLAKFIPPDEGAYWIAAGLDFSTFEIIQVTAILEVTFGNQFQLGLIGNAAMSIPEPAEPIAFISIDFEVIFAPALGIMGVLGKITPASFIFSRDCQITGGFAFFIWFGGEHEGDFVITIGGYYPGYNMPAWYPNVPRLGLKWTLGGLHIQGGSYFALTPHMLMAGLEVSATFEAGPVKLWFDMGIDFLLGWKPFFYLADAYIHIGLSLDIGFKITLHLGAEIYLWGPSFGGKVSIDLDIFTITVHFGSDAPTPPPIPWADFKKLLPSSQPDAGSGQGSALVALEDAPQKFSPGSVLISQGLLQEVRKDPVSENDFPNDKVFNWLIDPNHFQVLVLTGIPANNFVFNETDARATAGLTPASGHGIYLSPDDLSAFYTNPNNQNPNTSGTQFAYDYKNIPASDYWWELPVGVAPVDIPAGDFSGSEPSGFISTMVLKVLDLSAGQTEENNFVATIVSRNVAKSLWGAQVNANNGFSVVNDPSTLQYTLGGIVLSPKRWHPLQTKQINIYELLFEQGNNLCWPPVSAPQTGPNSYNEQITDQGNTMTFQPTGGGGVVTSQFRQLNARAFAQLDQGKQLIDQISALYGFTGLEVETDAAEMAEPVYRDWPILALLGEEDAAAANQVLN